MPLPKEYPSLKLFLTIHDLPLHKFIEAIVDGNLYSLIIAGQPTQEQLQEAWANILQQYTEASGNAEYKMYVFNIKQIALLTIKLNCIQWLVNVLRTDYHEPMCKELNTLSNTQFVFNPSNQENYQLNLNRCLNRSKSLKIRIDMLAHQKLAFEQKNDTASGKPTKEYYQSILITLSDFAKYPIHESSITVWEFCERMNRYNSYCEHLKSQTNASRKTN